VMYVSFTFPFASTLVLFFQAGLKLLTFHFYGTGWNVKRSRLQVQNAMFFDHQTRCGLMGARGFISLVFLLPMYMRVVKSQNL
jgi:hypothetical protein